MSVLLSEEYRIEIARGIEVFFSFLTFSLWTNSPLESVIKNSVRYNFCRSSRAGKKWARKCGKKNVVKKMWERK